MALQGSFSNARERDASERRREGDGRNAQVTIVAVSISAPRLVDARKIKSDPIGSRFGKSTLALSQALRGQYDHALVDAATPERSPPPSALRTVTRSILPYLDEPRVIENMLNAGGAPTSLLAAERDQLAMATLAAGELEEAAFEATALQVGLEFVAHEARQATVLFHALGKRWPVRGDRLVEDRVFRATAGIAIASTRRVRV